MKKGIWFVTVNLNTAVHAQALGFTKQIYHYAYAVSGQVAEELVKKWAELKGFDVKNIKSGENLAHDQDVRRYTFPHQIINLPKEDLEKEYDRREYPIALRDRGIVV